MSTLSKPLASLLLIGILSLGISLTILLEKATAPSMQASRDALRSQALLSVLPAQSYDNEPLQHPLALPGLAADSSVLEGFLATLEGQPGAIIFHSRAQGYAGPMELVMGVSAQGRLTGIKVLKHSETPGLGGRLASEPQWLNGLLGKSLIEPAETDWRLKQDGGAFDQIAGATITSRAVIEVIRETLRYFDTEKHHLMPDPKGDRL